jgi:hypothetical protein
VLVGLALASLPAHLDSGARDIFGDAAAGATRPAAAGKVVAPAGLQALEPKMLALKPNSARFSLAVNAVVKAKVEGPIGVGGPVFGRASAVSRPVLEESGEVSVSPPAASIRVSVAGAHAGARLIGTTLYVEEPSIKRLDGGRPWVEKRGETLSRALGEGSAGVGGNPLTRATHVVSLVREARAIRELGPATIDGQATTGFRLTVDFMRAERLSRRTRRALRKVFQPLAAVEVFIAANGLPVRTRATVRVTHRRGKLIAQSDIPAIEIPVTVQPPPAGETISEAALKRLELRLARQRGRHRARAKSR